MRQTFLLLFALWSFFPSPSFATADDVPHLPGLNMMGELGLNTLPSARLSPAGQSRFFLSRIGPYTHGGVGMQINDRLYLGLRQTSQSHSVFSNPDHLYPGMDVKFGLFRERRFLPQISVGIQSAFGHRRMAAEYLAMSKRYEDFDFTLGFGWGRLATRGGLPNPVLTSYIGNHSSGRAIDGEDPNSPRDWFTGDMGVFGGVEYNLPIRGLSFKADISSDAWKAERHAISDFRAPALWSIGLSYQPADWVQAGIAYAGQGSVMANLAFTPSLVKWPLGDYTPHRSLVMVAGRPEPSSYDNNEDGDDDEDIFEASLLKEKDLGIDHIFITHKKAQAELDLKDNLPTPLQIGDAARYLCNISGKSPEQVVLHLRKYGLKGRDITLNRHDLERAFLTHRGSSEEVWQTTQFIADTLSPTAAQLLGNIMTAQKESGFTLDFIQDVSLSEEDSGVLYRSGLVASLHRFFSHFFYTEQSLRINLADNLQKLNSYRSLSLYPVRSDIDVFSRNRLLLDRGFMTGFVTLGDDLHLASSIGYLEEMYMGATAEALYRPFAQNWSIGVEGHLALKRDPYSPLGLSPNGDRVLSGFLNGYYEFPGTGVTLKASAGRYLASDVGGSLGISNVFDNGVSIKADITATNQLDRDIYGGKTNFYTGLRLSLPLGSTPVLPDGSRMIVNAGPLGRDTGQRLENPVSLYDVIEPLSYRHITRQWQRLMPSS